MDALFAEALSDQVLFGNFHPTGANILICSGNTNAISAAKMTVNTVYKENFEYKESWIQVQKICKRHRVFSWLITIPRVRYEKATNRIYVDRVLWHTLVKVKSIFFIIMKKV